MEKYYFIGLSIFIIFMFVAGYLDSNPKFRKYDKIAMDWMMKFLYFAIIIFGIYEYYFIYSTSTGLLDLITTLSVFTAFFLIITFRFLPLKLIRYIWWIPGTLALLNALIGFISGSVFLLGRFSSMTVTGEGSSTASWAYIAISLMFYGGGYTLYSVSKEDKK